MKKIKERSPELIEVGKEVYNSLRKNYKIGTGHPTAKVEWWSPQFFMIEKDGKMFSVTVKELDSLSAANMANLSVYPNRRRES